MEAKAIEASFLLYVVTVLTISLSYGGIHTQLEKDEGEILMLAVQVSLLVDTDRHRRWSNYPPSSIP